MQNVLKALRYMAENGSRNYGSDAGVWYLYLHDARSYSNVCVGFAQDEMQAFLRHYEKVLSFARSYDPNYEEVSNED